MLAAMAFRTHEGASLFAGIFGIEAVEQIAKRCKVVITFGTVHATMDGNKANLAAWENQFRVLSAMQTVTVKTAHVLDDEVLCQSLLRMRKCFLDAGAIEIRPGVTIIHENPDVDEPVFLCVFR